MSGEGGRRVGALALAGVLVAASLVTVYVVWQATLPAPTQLSCPVTSAPSAESPIQHLFVIVKENHAFENYFGDRPGVIGFPPNGSLLSAFGSNATIHPFALNAVSTPDLPHDHGSALIDLDHGKNDQFVAQARALGFADPSAAAGYYTAAEIPQYYAYASNYSLDDMFFTGILGPTEPNRLFDLAATSDGVSNDTYVPNGQLNSTTILNELSDHGVRWAYDYTGDPQNLVPFEFESVWNDSCVNRQVDPMSDFASQLASPLAPQVTIIDPSHDEGGFSEHPADNVTLGTDWTTTVVNAIFSSPLEPTSAVVIFFDEAGGFWDPIVPPSMGPLGDGFRVPFLVLSPYTPKGLLLHETLDPASVLHFIDENWGLPALNDRVASAPSLGGFFDFNSTPRPPLLLPTTVSLAAASLSIPWEGTSASAPPGSGTTPDLTPPGGAGSPLWVARSESEASV